MFSCQLYSPGILLPQTHHANEEYSLFWSFNKIFPFATRKNTRNRQYTQFTINLNLGKSHLQKKYSIQHSDHDLIKTNFVKLCFDQLLETTILKSGWGMCIWTCHFSNLNSLILRIQLISQYSVIRLAVAVAVAVVVEITAVVFIKHDEHYGRSRADVSCT